MISDRTFNKHTCQFCACEFDLGSAILEASKNGLVHFGYAGSVDLSGEKSWAGFMVRVPCPECASEMECVLDCEVNEMEVRQIGYHREESYIRYS